MLIHDDTIITFIEKQLERISEVTFDRTVVRCGVCKHKIDIPIIARRSDVERFQKLLQIADKYLKDKGGIEAMLKDIKQQIENGLANKNDTFN